MKGAALALAVLGIGGAPAGLPQRSDVDMVGIPGGVFQMGSIAGRDDEQPVHSVRISAFVLSRMAVTVGQFRAFVDASGYRTEAERSGGCLVFTGQGWETRRDADWRNPGFSQGDDHPGLGVVFGLVWELPVIPPDRPDRPRRRIQPDQPGGVLVRCRERLLAPRQEHAGRSRQRPGLSSGRRCAIGALRPRRPIRDGLTKGA